MNADDLARLRSDNAEARLGRLNSTGGLSGQSAVYLTPDELDALLDAAALGLAWNRVEAALPEGWVLAEVRIHDDRSEWGAEAANDTGEGPYRAMGYGPTPTAAVLALADKLEAREP